jgi:pilus assembly protein CpaB
MFFRRRKTLLILTSLILATLITGVQYIYFKRLSEPEPTVRVLTAARDIPAGMRIDGRLSEKSIPRSAFQPNMVQAGTSVSGYALVDIPAGSYLLENMISGSPVPVVEGNMRRVSISVSLSSALAGRIRPGDRVDIGWVPKDAGKGGDSVIIAEKVQIYGVFNRMGEDAYASADAKRNMYEKEVAVPAVVTLIVTPEQAVRLKQCEALGSLFLLGY